jgi:hypothetical protein
MKPTKPPSKTDYTKLANLTPLDSNNTQYHSLPTAKFHGSKDSARNLSYALREQQQDDGGVHIQIQVKGHRR